MKTQEENLGPVIQIQQTQVIQVAAAKMTQVEMNLQNLAAMILQNLAAMIQETLMIPAAATIQSDRKNKTLLFLSISSTDVQPSTNPFR